MNKTKPIITTALLILILGLSLAACQAGPKQSKKTFWFNIQRLVHLWLVFMMER